MSRETRSTTGSRSLKDFLASHGQREEPRRFFELETKRLLEVNLDGLVWARTGAMIAYSGEIRFEREGIAEHGLGKMLKKAVTGEGMSLMKATGTGRVYFAHEGKKVQLLELDGERITVNGNDILALEEGLDWDITMMRKVSGMMAGGLFNVAVSGTGSLAITTHHDPLVLRVEPGRPVFTDPNATVAWTGDLDTRINTDVNLKTFLGRGSGESFQLEFDGDGFVLVQPHEEVYMQQGS